MSTFITTLGSGTAVVPTRDIFETLREMRDSLDDLVKRMRIAMAAIAEAEGAYECDRCGRYTRETIELEDYSEELGREVDEYCPACVPSRSRYEEVR